jgi:sugar lactone lactonase YvrE
MNETLRRRAGYWSALLLQIAMAGIGLAQTYEWTTIAGSRGGVGFQDGSAGTARFNRPAAVAVDPATGHIFLVEAGNHSVRKITPQSVTTLAGKGGVAGNADGSRDVARFRQPGGLALAADGSIYVADTGNHTIRKISPLGDVVTLAGMAGEFGMIDGDGPAARFSSPTAIALTADGSLVVADTGNHSIRRVTPDGAVTTVAGTSGLPGFADGAQQDARFSSPSALAISSDGTLYVADTDNCLIRKISTAGQVETVAGTLYGYDHLDGVGTAAGISYPTGLALDATGNLYVADAGSVTIRKIDIATRKVTTIAGDVWEMGFTDGNPGRFAFPAGMTLTDDGTLLVADTDNHALRSVSPDGQVGTVAAPPPREPGAADGDGGSARFRNPYDLACTPDGVLFVADTANRTVRKISPQGEVSTLAGTAGLSGTDDGSGGMARFTSPRGVTVGPDGHVHVADVVTQQQGTIRRITPDGIVTTLAGTPGSLPDDQTLYLLSGIATLPSGHLAATDISAIRRITPDGIASFIAGSKRFITYYTGGSITFWRSGSNDGTGSNATFFWPSGVAADEAGNLFVTESGGCVIRKVSPNAVVTTIAGTAVRASGTPVFRDGTGPAAGFVKPEGIAVDAMGILYVADTGSHTIRKVSPQGVVTTIGGLPGYAGSGDGVGDRAIFHSPSGVAVDAMGNVYVADRYSHRIVKGTPEPLARILVRRADGSPWPDSEPQIDFGSLPPGTTSEATLLAISNVGHTPLRIDEISITGDQATAFALDRSGLPVILQPGSGGIVRITVTPQNLGPSAATLRIRSNDVKNPLVEVALRALGNNAPVFAGYAVTSTGTATVNIPLVKLLAAARDPDGDVLTVTSVAWPAESHGTLTLRSHTIQFVPRKPANPGTIIFQVTIADTRGATVTGDVIVTVLGTGSAAGRSALHNPPKLSMKPGGDAGISFHGIPGTAYLIQRSVDMLTWHDLASVTADATGLIQHIDPSPPKPSAYYRIAIP